MVCEIPSHDGCELDKVSSCPALWGVACAARKTLTNLDDGNLTPSRRFAVQAGVVLAVHAGSSDLTIGHGPALR
jgi:hypothetical protein